VSQAAFLYTDEDMSGLVAMLLRARGLDVTTVPEQNNLGKSDYEQLEFAARSKRCLLTHNRVDFEKLHIRFLAEDKQHSGILIVPQKNPYEVAQRIGILVSSLPRDIIQNQLLYA